MRQFIVKTGISYPDPAAPGEERRPDIGELIDDLPADAEEWMLEQGYIAHPEDEAPAEAPVEVVIAPEVAPEAPVEAAVADDEEAPAPVGEK